MSECERCRGDGRVADTEDQEPWKDWLELPARAATAMLLGLVKPMPCPACNGSGTTPSEGR